MMTDTQLLTIYSIISTHIAGGIIIVLLVWLASEAAITIRRMRRQRENKRRLEAQKEQEPQEQPRIDFVLVISGLDEFQAGLAEIEAAFVRIAERGAAIESPITINNHYNARPLQWPNDAPQWEWTLGTDANAEPVEGK